MNIILYIFHELINEIINIYIEKFLTDRKINEKLMKYFWLKKISNPSINKIIFKN